MTEQRLRHVSQVYLQAFGVQIDGRVLPQQFLNF